MAVKGEGIVERSLVEDDHILEQEKLIIEGVDVSGRWNTFLAPRVQEDYTPSLEAEVRALGVGENIRRCWQCGMCTASCTANSVYPDFNPRHFIYLVKLGDVQRLAKLADVVWRCVGCYKCSQRCPREVNPAEVMEAIGVIVHRRWGERVAREEQVGTGAYKKQIYGTGRLNLATLMAADLRGLGRQRELLSAEQMRIGMKMFRDSRLFHTLRLGRAPGWSRLRRVLEEHRRSREEVHP
ncbi:MAG: 4Fe-4S dicluster domain-containing protein [Thermaerobacter sp.]|jgi:heterodisulfide reductase subunit C|nr:4Fe-4S dicluster domain-containing protein [Thermaerobacter sp.]